MKFLLLASALALPFCPDLAAQSATARVNDPASHGVVGDSKLSLDEAIRLLNEDLTLPELSAAEQAQVSGTGLVLTIEIDATAAPVITLERLLTPFDGPGSHDEFDVVGVGGTPEIEAGTLDAALRIRTNHAHIENMAIHGGQRGIVADTSVHAHHDEMLMLHEIEFSNQTVAVRLQAEGDAAIARAMIEHCEFHDLDTALQIDDKSRAAGHVMIDGTGLHIERVRLGADVYTEGEGNMTMCRLFRSKVHETVQLMQSRRSLLSTQRLMLMLVVCDVEVSGDAVDIQGNADSETIFHHHHSNITAGAGRRAFHLWPQDGRFDFHGSENVISGDALIFGGRLNRRIWMWNTLFKNGTFAVSNIGTRPSMRWNRFEDCVIRAEPTNSAPLSISSSEFVRCTLDGQSRLGPVDLDNCYLSGCNTVGEVRNSNPAPSRWFSIGDVSTHDPLLGGHFDLSIDLPPGMMAVWHLGMGDVFPLLTEEPFRFYALRQTYIPLPGLYILNTTIRLPVPAIPQIAGKEIYAQPVTFPYMGQTHVPLINFPRGAHVTAVAQ